MSHSADIKAAAVNLAAWFPVEHDSDGGVTAYAAEATIGAMGETEFFIIRLGHNDSPVDNGCDCANCAPHEQMGPVPPEWWYVHTLPRCVATTQKGARCRNLVQDDHPTGMCYQHRKQRRV